MGQFSWFAQDTGEQIYNDWDIYPEDKQTIHMVDPRDGTDYKEEGYEGYGVFGGRDFYELFADINKDTVKQYCPTLMKRFDDYDKVMSKPFKELTKDEINVKRLLGIDLWYSYIQPDPIHQFAPKLPVTVRIASPILVMDYNKWQQFIGDAPEDDPDQGWHCEEEDEE